MTKLYQAIENLLNPDFIEQHGPFKCNDKDAWLGQGYYFWEHYEKNAHWWGETRYKKNGYVICKSSYTNDPSTCFDLVDNFGHRGILKSAIDLLKEQKLYKHDKTTITRVLEYLIKIGVFTYKATRMSIPSSRGRDSKHNESICVNENTTLSFDLIPQIQVCFYDKALISANGYTIIYPQEYVDGYLA